MRVTPELSLGGIDLPVPMPLDPMESEAVRELPSGPGWLYAQMGRLSLHPVQGRQDGLHPVRERQAAGSLLP
jgi:hypothetical protein